MSTEIVLSKLPNSTLMKSLDKHLVIKKSTLPQAGKGLFSRKFIPRGTKLVEYKGKVTTWKEVSKDGKENGYIYYVKRDHVIDAAKRKKAKARYANDADGLTRIKGIRNNSEYVEDGLKVYIQTKKDILPGDEILVGYGKEYWQVIRHNKRVEEREKGKNQK